MTRTARSTAARTSTCSRGSGARATGSSSRSAAAASSPGAPTPRSTAAASASARASSTASSRSCRRSSTASSCISRTTRAAPGELLLFVVLADGAALDDDLRAAHRPQPALGALAAPRARHDPRRARDSPHADRQEARDARQAHPAAASRRRPSPAGTRCSTRPRSTRSPSSRRRRTAGVAERRSTLEDVVAIDVHTHVEMSEAGGDSLPDDLREAAVRHFRGESARPDGGRARGRTTASGR